METEQVVIVTATGVVLRAGYTDFEHDGTFDPATETILREGIDFLGRAAFDPPPPEATWAWDGNDFVRL